MNLEYNNILICLIQIVSIYNAIFLGWKVKKIGLKTYELSKKIKEPNTFDINEFINDIVSFRIIK